MSPLASKSKIYSKYVAELQQLTKSNYSVENLVTRFEFQINYTWVKKPEVWTLCAQFNCFLNLKSPSHVC